MLIYVSFDVESFVNKDPCPEGRQFDRNQRFRVSAAQMEWRRWRWKVIPR